jgi:hypothetical protein
VQSAERRRQAVGLRLAGASYESIGHGLGISKQAAHKLVMGALEELAKRTAEDVAEMRQLELGRIDEILLALWTNRRDPRTADTILRAMDRRARLLGLDVAPEHRKPLVVEVRDPHAVKARLLASLEAEEAAKD